MTDTRTDDSVDPADPADGDRLPWLEAVEEEDSADGPSAAKLIAFVVIGLVAIGLIVGGLFWVGSSGRDEGGEPELIAAAEGPYKVRPDQPGGMQVEGKGDTSFAASEGADPKGRIDLAAVPETPVAKSPDARPSAPAPQPKAAPAPAPSRAEPAPAPAPAAGGATVQLGAFSTQAGANNAWKALSGRFKYLAPLNHSVIPVTIDGRTLYRLRASGPDAANLCNRLRVAGESCERVG